MGAKPLLIVLLVAALAPCLPLPLPAQCPPITKSQQDTLLGYVRTKYKLPPDFPLRLQRDGPVAKSCNERVRFVSADPARYFNYSVILLPDHVFFAREIIDSRSDPLAAERKVRQLAQERLLSGKPPSKGPANASVTVVVFSDFQCPYCAQAAQEIAKALPASGVDARLAYRFFPLASIHPWALPAAKAAACLHAQSPEAFWSLHDYYFQNQRAFTKENIAAKSAELVKSLPVVSMEAYESCVQSSETQALIDKDMELGKALQVRGTPAIFVNGQRTGAGELAQAIRDAAAETHAVAKRGPGRQED